MTRKSRGSRTYLPSATVALYAFGHFAVDLGCVCYLVGAAGQSAEGVGFFGYYVLYNLAAFAMQPFLGRIGDRFQRPRGMAALGILMVLAGLPLGAEPGWGVPLVGLGNALYHLGGGTIAANLESGRSRYLGLFVAPGALGLLAAPWLAKAPAGLAWAGALLGVALVLLALVPDETVYPRERNPLRSGVLLGLLAVVGLRSFVGFSVVYPWKVQVPLLVVFTLAVVSGKVLGGVVGDRFGWRRTAVGSMLASLLLVPFGAISPALGILGMGLFNFTMPLVLAALVREMPRNPGFAFGLNCLALILGAFPLVVPMTVPLPLAAVGILVSAGLLWVSLEGPAPAGGRLVSMRPEVPLAAEARC